MRRDPLREQRYQLSMQSPTAKDADDDRIGGDVVAEPAGPAVDKDGVCSVGLLPVVCNDLGDLDGRQAVEIGILGDGFGSNGGLGLIQGKRYCGGGDRGVSTEKVQNFVERG